ncbi:ABC transporter substrate-binding protein [Nocardioides sp. Kera G14]|uniref:ABC transporter substrate-binding protein n=1 Tax=Nocardioides sp. Kera G14 TaxID=2884264 RepID=UPI001D125500|nr:ABC transporter substrate-binding protein [Nocardioides sp. Kera G14]UDY22883.1 ABC transporter substrate-binding protein [Nocardioides sp. Kera G14]
MNIRTRLRHPVAALGAAVLVASLAACGGSDEKSAVATGDPSAISSSRCAANKAAGQITYMSGYYWQASASILEMIAADQLGYYKDLCLDVKMEPGQGDTSVNAKLVQAGQVQIGPLSEQDIITSNQSTLENGGEPKILGVSSYSDAGLDILMTNPDITDLKQLEGKTLGQKGYVPLSVSAMLGKAGVDMKKVKTVKVGYDPTILPRGQVDALTGFISNEPNLLKDAGDKVTVWEPTKYGVPGSVGSIAVNADWAKKNPGTVEDFLRATFKAFQYCAEDAHVDECIGYQQKQNADPSDDKDHEKDVWTTEAKLVADNPLPTGWGTVDPDNVTVMVANVNSYMGGNVDQATASTWFTNDYVKAVVSSDGKVVWPAK